MPVTLLQSDPEQRAASNQRAAGRVPASFRPSVACHKPDRGRAGGRSGGTTESGIPRGARRSAKRTCRGYAISANCIRIRNDWRITAL
jgi:hypothetical protein